MSFDVKGTCTAMIMGLSHVALVASDIEKAFSFYCGVLGFERLFDINNEDGSIRLSYIKITDGQFFELFNGKNASPSHERDTGLLHLPDYLGFSHLCLEVDDIHEIAERLRANNALIAEPKIGKDSNYQCWGLDPDLNKIEFMQFMADSPQKQTKPSGK